MTGTSKLPRILAVILAGGAGGRLGVLTDRRAKPAMPVGGSYRLIDIPLSNLAHSGIADVWLVEQYQPHSLNEHLANGRPWDLDRTRGGLRVMPPFEGSEGDGFAQGNADALAKQAEFIRQFDPDLVLVLSADHLYTLDYRDVVQTHLGADAALTVVTTETDRDASQFGVVESTEGRITGFEYKPEQPRTQRVTAEVFLYDADILLSTLQKLAEGQQGLQDYGDALLPHFVEHETVAEHRLDSYWADVGTIESYFAAHMELVRGRGIRLDNPDWPTLTASPQRQPAFIAAGARVEDSLLAPGATVAGTVVHSVVGPGAVIEAGASVSDAVLLGDVTVAAGAVVEQAIIDVRTTVGGRAAVGGPTALTVVGRDVRIDDGSIIDPGTEVAPG